MLCIMRCPPRIISQSPFAGGEALRRSRHAGMSSPSSAGGAARAGLKLMDFRAEITYKDSPLLRPLFLGTNLAAGRGCVLAPCLEFCDLALKPGDLDFEPLLCVA